MGVGLAGFFCCGAALRHAWSGSRLVVIHRHAALARLGCFRLFFGNVQHIARIERIGIADLRIFRDEVLRAHALLAGNAANRVAMLDGVGFLLLRRLHSRQQASDQGGNAHG